MAKATKGTAPKIARGQKTEWVKAIYAENPTWSGEQVVAEIEKRHGVKVSLQTVYKAKDVESPPKAASNGTPDLDKMVMEFILFKHGGSIPKAKKALEALAGEVDAAIALAKECNGVQAALDRIAALEARAEA